MTALLDLPVIPVPSPVVVSPGPTTRSAPAAAPTATPATVRPGVRPAPRTRPVRLRPVHGGRCAHDAAGGATALDGRSVASRAVRLTRRGRLTVTVLTLLCSILFLAVAAAQGGSAGGSLSDAPATVVVGSGDTLWQIAQEIAPADNPAEVVRALQAANDLGRQPLRPGQVLRVPTG